MKLNQYGAINGIAISLVLVTLLFIASLVFGIWSFSGRQKYKNDTQQLINSAVASAKTQQQNIDNANYFIQSQKPLIEYVGPEAYGTIKLFYPKNWSSYVNDSGTNGYPIDGYFYPGTLPSVTDGNQVNFALRLQVENQSYQSVLGVYDSLVQANQTVIKAYSLPKVPSVVGVEVVGQLANNLSGTLVILPLRSEALEIWTEGTQYLSEFNNDILPNLSFSP
ncbi:MAG: hypothetical protein ACYCPS_02915 [Candidatus Saccharimonadales bacterium]